MFRTLARLLNDPTLSSPGPLSPEVFEIHPYQLSQWLEATWTWSSTVASWLGSGYPAGQSPFLGNPGIVGALELPEAPDAVLTLDFLRSGIPTTAAQIPGFTANPGAEPAPGQDLAVPLGLPWEHAAYALLIESTGVYEILAEVTRRYVIGETLEPPSLDTQQWLRATEELFFRDPPLYHIAGITSQFRPDMRVTRRNLYWRLLGMDLPHPLPPGHRPADEQPWKRDTAVTNVRFHELWLEFLRQVWIGYENVTNTSGAKPTDPNYIAQVCQYLQEMLTMRRLNGLLAREEFMAVSELSWFHLTVEFDTPLVQDLRAQGSDPFDRLVKIGERVGMKPSPRSWELFKLADLMSGIVRFIELGAFNNAAVVPALYTPGTSLQNDMLAIIDLWQMATGDSIKDQGVRVSKPGPAVSASQSGSQPRPAQPAHSLSSSGNGHRPVTGPLLR
jgi:hypothetical protein